MDMFKSFGWIQVAVCLFVFTIAAKPAQSAEHSSIRGRAATVVTSGEALAQAIRSAYRKTGAITKNINDLVSEGFLAAYPRTTDPQSDFYNKPIIIDRGSSTDYFIRYSFAEQDAVDVCATINETALGLRPDSPVSETSLQSSPVTAGAFVFAPMPVETAGKKSFCLKVDGNFQYFLQVMPVQQ